MRFITEDELRLIYRSEAFDRYELPADSRLTPGARQFLVDYRVEIVDASQPVKRTYRDEEVHDASKDEGQEGILFELIFTKIRQLELIFLKTAADLAENYPELSGTLIQEAEKISVLREPYKQPVRDESAETKGKRTGLLALCSPMQVEAKALYPLYLLENHVQILQIEMDMILPAGESVDKWKQESGRVLEESKGVLSNLAYEFLGGNEHGI